MIQMLAEFISFLCNESMANKNIEQLFLLKS